MSCNFKIKSMQELFEQFILSFSHGSRRSKRLDKSNIEWTAVESHRIGWRNTSIVYTTALDAIISVFHAQHMPCTNATHSKRHSGAKEAVRLKIPEEDIKTGGRWCTGLVRCSRFI